MTEEQRKRVAKLHDSEEYQVFYRNLPEHDPTKWYECHVPSAQWDWGANEYRIYVATNDLPVLLNSYSIYYCNHEFFFMDVDTDTGTTVIRKIIADEIFPYEAAIITNKADTHIEGSLSVDNNLSVDGNSEVQGTLNVINESTFNNSVNVKELSSIKVNGVPLQNNFVDNVTQKNNGAISYTLSGLNEKHDVLVYTHHAQTALTGKPEKNVAPGFGDIVTVSQPIVDAEGHTTALNDKTIQIPYNTATSEKDGLMSFDDKAFLDTVDSRITNEVTARTNADTNLQKLITANTDAITVLNGDSTVVGSVSRSVSDGIASVIASAPEDLDTLKEISDWIDTHEDSAAAMNSAINTNKTNLSSHTSNTSNPHNVTASQVGLNNVDNTADVDKNVKSATTLTTPRSLKVKLDSTSAQNFDGSGNANEIGVAGVLSATNGGTGKTSLNAAANALINELNPGDSDPKDDDYYVSQYAGGGTTTTTYHRRPISKLWNYIRTKVTSVLGLSSITNSDETISSSFSGDLTVNSGINAHSMLQTYSDTVIPNTGYTAKRNALLIYGDTYGNDSNYVQNSGKITYGDGNPQIVFNTVNSLDEPKSQPLALVYSDHDTIATGASLSLVTNQTSASFIAPVLNATSDIQVNSTSLFPSGYIERTYFLPSVQKATITDAQKTLLKRLVVYMYFNRCTRIRGQISYQTLSDKESSKSSNVFITNYGTTDIEDIVFINDDNSVTVNSDAEYNYCMVSFLREDGVFVSQDIADVADIFLRETYNTLSSLNIFKLSFNLLEKI